MTYAIILAGGSGTRFWPLSRQLAPKQFLSVGGEKSLVEQTIHRISALIKSNNIYITTNRIYYPKIKIYFKKSNIPLKNIISEPQGKNTFAPIGVLSSQINHISPDAVVVVLPCDHLIRNKIDFLHSLKKSMEVARQGYIVTLGVLPTRPETGYGYIRIKSKTCPAQARRDLRGVKNPRTQISSVRGRQKSKIYSVDSFIEKPNLKMAKLFIKDKRYYWNSGIFIFRSDVMLEEIRQFLPLAYRTIMKIKRQRDFRQWWPKLPSISIDYAIMEKTKNMVLLPLDCGWQDVGNLQALVELTKKDKDGNIFMGKCIDIGSKDSMVLSCGRLVATMGLNNLVIVDTEDALLVCPIDRTQDVKKIVQILKRRNLKKQI